MLANITHAFTSLVIALIPVKNYKKIMHFHSKKNVCLIKSPMAKKKNKNKKPTVANSNDDQYL